MEQLRHVQGEKCRHCGATTIVSTWVENRLLYYFMQGWAENSTLYLVVTCPHCDSV